jgi:Putative transposase
VLSKLFRRLMLEKLVAAHSAGKLTFYGNHAPLADAVTFAKWLAPLRKKRWFVYAKEPFAGPKAVLAYLSRYTHRVAISNSRLLKADASGVTFRVKNYRVDGDARYTTMTLAPGEFIRRVLLHVLPKGFHRIRHTGFLASSSKAENIEKARALLDVAQPEPASAGTTEQAAEPVPSRKCPCCGGDMHIIETFVRGETPRHRAEPSRLVIRIDTS